jgi:hypothetical protein
VQGRDDVPSGLESTVLPGSHVAEVVTCEVKPSNRLEQRLIHRGCGPVLPQGPPALAVADLRPVHRERVLELVQVDLTVDLCALVERPYARAARAGGPHTRRTAQSSCSSR